MYIELDRDELIELAMDRDINLRNLLHNYLDEVIDESPNMLWDLEEEMSKDARRCTACGFWTPAEQMVGEECEECSE